MVTVAEPHNAPDTRYETPGYGRVDYVYQIGKYEVSNAEYAEFLNAVAAMDDTHHLYNPWMDGGGEHDRDSGGIVQLDWDKDDKVNWLYTVRENRGNRPVTYVSFWSACRFANWLHNGQPTGPQDLGTTEDGAYFLGGVTEPPNDSISREANWRWAVTSEDEWYKAAYYDGGSGVYYDYPTGSNTPPTAEAPPGTDVANGSANYLSGSHLDTEYYTTQCGAYNAKPSDSPYGTFDQGGNVWEFNETIIGRYRCLLGGGFSHSAYRMNASFRDNEGHPARGYDHVGFRVVRVPEPASITMLLAGAAGILACVPRKRRR